MFFISFQGIAQKQISNSDGFADKDYYLVDGLKLEDLAAPDVQLLDSCLKLYHQAKHDTDKINALFGICEYLNNDVWQQYQFFQFDIIKQNIKQDLPPATKNKFVDYFVNASYNIAGIYGGNREFDKSEKYYNNTLLISETLNDSLGIAESLSGLGYLYNITGELDKSLAYYERSLAMFEELNIFSSADGLLNNLGIMYQNQGDIEKSLACLLRSLKIREKLGSKGGIAESYNNIGSIYVAQKEDEKALDYFKKTIKLSEEIGRDGLKATALNNIAAIHRNQKNTQQSLENFLECLEIQKNINDQTGIALSLNNIGYIYGRMKEFDKSIDYYENSLKAYEELKDEDHIATVLQNMADVYLVQFNKNKNKSYLEKSKSYALKSHSIAEARPNIKNKQDVAYVLSRIYKAEGDGMKALKFYKTGTILKDSVNNEATQKATIRQQTQYEFEKAQIVKENEAKEQARLLEESTTRRNNLQYSLIFLGILLLFGVVLSLGFVKVSPNIAEGLIFFAFLIMFEFILVFTDPYLQDITHDEPMYNLAANALIALLIFPLHAILERLLKKRIVKT